jgi:hypothetical protein
MIWEGSWPPAAKSLVETMPEKKKTSEPSDAALKARLAQLELENRMRLQNNQPSASGNPIKDTPRRGFGSAQGIAHLRHTEYQRRGSTPPAAPPPIPEPGKARFGGTYLRTPLPGIISADATPGNELIAPVPVVPTSPAPPPAKEVRTQPLQGVGMPPATPAPGSAAPSGVMPGGRPLPDPAPSPAPAKEAAKAVPVAAQFDPNKGNVIGGRGASKAPLPAVYHAGVKSAEAADRAKADMAAKPHLPSAAAAMAKPEAEKTIVIPEGVEVTKDEPKAPTRVKRFKNPTLGPGPK